jgi:gas vesicle protein
MNNKKIAAGILTIIGAGLLVGMVLKTKKGRQTSRNLLKKGNRITDDLKGKFNDFVDMVSAKAQGLVK